MAAPVPLELRTCERRSVVKRVMFYCQHVLGMGHLIRSAEIVRALSKDFKVLFVTGGEPSPNFGLAGNIKLLQLEPLKSDPEFANIHVCNPALGLEETKVLRQEQLLRSFCSFRPDVLVTELFPFGRKQFSFELIPLLEHASSSPRTPLIVSSIRDVLVTKKDQAKHEQRVTDILNRFYDLVLVHGDERFLRLEDTFSRVGDLCCPVEYTGYVVQQEKQTAAKGHGRSRPTIVVSNGGGGCLSGHLLLESVLRAATLLQDTLPHAFHVFAGPLMPEGAYQRLEALVRLGGNVRLARYTSDLPAHLRRAQLSVSMAGYNTVMDILSTRVRALVYPVTANGDQEQSVRARKLEKMGVLKVLAGEQLEPVRLALEILRALRSKPSQIILDLAGAENSSLVIQKHLDAWSTHTLQTQATFPVAERSWRASHRGGNQIEEGALCD